MASESGWRGLKQNRKKTKNLNKATSKLSEVIYGLSVSFRYRISFFGRVLYTITSLANIYYSKRCYFISSWRFEKFFTIFCAYFLLLLLFSLFAILMFSVFIFSAYPRPSPTLICIEPLAFRQ